MGEGLSQFFAFKFVNMPLVGLPTSLESVLATLLMKNSISSWTVKGECENSLIFIRLCPTESDTGLPSHTNRAVSYRRKPPSAVLRDKKRAQQHRQRTTTTTTATGQHTANILDDTTTNSNDNNINNNDSGTQTGTHKDTVCKLFLSTPEIEQHEHALLQASTMPGTQDTEPRASRGDPPLVDTVGSDSGEGEGLFHAACTDVTGSDTVNKEWVAAYCLPRSLEEIADSDTSLDYVETLAAESGFDPNEVKERVSEITRRKIQTSLRDRGRNTDFEKVVLDTRSGAQRLLLESEDIVFIYDFTSQISDWFIKQADHRLTGCQRDVVTCLRRWPAVDTSDTADLAEIAEGLRNDLVVCMELIRHFLGEAD